jgi:hypothetical protein
MESIFKRHIPQLEEEATRLEVRRNLYYTIKERGDKETAYKEYEKHAAVIVPTSVDRWARRREEDVPKARAITLRQIFDTDVELFENGIFDKHTGKIKLTEGLKDALAADHIRKIEIEVKLKKLQNSKV